MFPDVSKQKNLDTNPDLVKAEEYIVLGDSTNIANSNALVDNGRMDPLDRVTDQTYTPNLDASADSEQNDRAFKPSKIPVLKTKHVENSSNDASSVKIPEEYDTNRTLNVAYSGIPTSPITGKKYRSPLSAPKALDRSRKLQNGNITNNNSCDNVNLAEAPIVSQTNIVSPVQTSRSIADESIALAAVVAKNESNSGRDTPNLNTGNKSQGDMSNIESLKDHASLELSEMSASEKKPKFKWMFGPHRNANVVYIDSNQY